MRKMSSVSHKARCRHDEVRVVEYNRVHIVVRSQKGRSVDPQGPTSNTEVRYGETHIRIYMRPSADPDPRSVALRGRRRGHGGSHIRHPERMADNPNGVDLPLLQAILGGLYDAPV